MWEFELKMNREFACQVGWFSPLLCYRYNMFIQPITAHTRKAKLFRQSKSFVSFGIFVSNKAFRSSFLALQVCADRYMLFQFLCTLNIIKPLELVSINGII
jgi:hypothetical protein